MGKSNFKAKSYSAMQYGHGMDGNVCEQDYTYNLLTVLQPGKITTILSGSIRCPTDSWLCLYRAKASYAIAGLHPCLSLQWEPVEQRWESLRGAVTASHHFLHGHELSSVEDPWITTQYRQVFSIKLGFLSFLKWHCADEDQTAWNRCT